MSNNTENSAASSQAPEITLNDFANIVRIIDVASRRGAFEGKELSSVGSVRDKVEAFVVHYAPKQDQGQSENGQPESSEEGSSDTEIVSMPEQ